jgi:hypothetical protein
MYTNDDLEVHAQGGCQYVRIHTASSGAPEPPHRGTAESRAGTCHSGNKPWFICHYNIRAILPPEGGCRRFAQ